MVEVHERPKPPQRPKSAKDRVGAHLHEALKSSPALLAEVVKTLKLKERQRLAEALQIPQGGKKKRTGSDDQMR